MPTKGGQGDSQRCLTDVATAGHLALATWPWPTSGLRWASWPWAALARSVHPPPNICPRYDPQLRKLRESEGEDVSSAVPGSPRRGYRRAQARLWEGPQRMLARNRAVRCFCQLSVGSRGVLGLSWGLIRALSGRSGSLQGCHRGPMRSLDGTNMDPEWRI